MRKLVLFSWVGFLAVLLACAPDRTGAGLVAGSVEKSAGKDRPVAYFAEFVAPDSLRKAYAVALERAGLYRFFEEQPSAEELQNAVVLRIRLSSSGEERWRSWWYLGLGVAGPLWPAMPLTVSTVLRLEAEVWQRGSMLRRLRLEEAGEIVMHYYGPYRWQMVQRETDWLHQVLLARFVAELQRSELDNSDLCSF
jgi:hypothetical protein